MASITEIHISDTPDCCTNDRITPASADDEGVDDRDVRGYPGGTVVGAFMPGGGMVACCGKSVFRLFNAGLGWICCRLESLTTFAYGFLGRCSDTLFGPGAVATVGVGVSSSGRDSYLLRSGGYSLSSSNRSCWRDVDGCGSEESP